MLYSGTLRSPWRSLYERDLDLLLLDLLHTSSEFGGWFVNSILDVDPEVAVEFEGAWHSVVGLDGRESDIEATWCLPDGQRLHVMIEDKLNARCQPDQASAYRMRALQYRELEEMGDVVTVLVAPEGYPERYPEDTAPFDHCISIEAIQEWIEQEESLGTRSRYLTEILGRMLDRTRGGAFAPAAPRSGAGAGGGKPHFPDLYDLVRTELARLFPELRITNSTPGEWIYFSFPGRVRGVSLRHRLRDHWAELVLSRKAFEDEDVRAAGARGGLKLAERGETEFALWQPTPEIDLVADPPSQVDAIRAALAIVAELAEWFARSGLGTEGSISSSTTNGR